MHYKTHNKQTSIPIVLYFIIIFYQNKKFKKRIESWVSRVDQKKRDKVTSQYVFTSNQKIRVQVESANTPNFLFIFLDHQSSM